MVYFVYIVLFSFHMFFSGCLKKESSSANATPLTRVVSNSSNEKCPKGGVLVALGADTNLNNYLDDAEITERKDVCLNSDTNTQNNTPSSNSDNENNTNDNETPATYAILTENVSSSEEECPYGGRTVYVGLDNGDGGSTANDGVLQEGETDQTVFVCNVENNNENDSESNPPSNTAFEAVVQNRNATAEECPFGGTATDVGVDDGTPSGTAHDDLLSAAEIERTVLSCNAENINTPTDGFDILTLNRTATLEECPFGGIATDVGLDDGTPSGTAHDDLLSAAEIESTVLSCNAENTNTPTDGFDILTLNRTATLEECPFGGIATDVGLDDGLPSGVADDQLLSEDETSDTVLQCNEPPVVPPAVHAHLVSITDASASVCAGGGTTVRSGLDNGDGNGIADDGVLQNGEIDNTENRCKSVASVRSLETSFGRVSAVPSMRGNARTDMIPSFDTDTPYVSDKPVVSTYDISAEAFYDVNQLLCLLNQTQYRQMRALGHTTYTAVVSLVSCPAVGSLDYGSLLTDASYSSVSDPYDPVLWTLQVSGDGETLPIEVRFWGMHAPGWDPSSPHQMRHIAGQLTVYKAPTENNPLGLIALHARSEDTGGSLADTDILLSLKSSQNPLMYGSESIKTEFVRMRPTELLVAATMFQDASAEHGHGTIDIPTTSGFTGTRRFIYRYDPSEFKRREETYTGNAFTGTLQNSETRVFDRTVYDQSVFGYGTYNMLGQRVQAYTNMDFVVFDRLLQSTRDGRCIGATCTSTARLPQPSELFADYAYHFTTAEVYENRRRGYTSFTYEAAQGLLYRETTHTLNLDDLENRLLAIATGSGPAGWTYVLWNGTDWSRLSPSPVSAWTRPAFSHTEGASTDWVLTDAADHNVVYRISAENCEPAPFYGPNHITCAYTSNAVVVKEAVSEQVSPADTNNTLTLYCIHNCVDPRTLNQAGSLFYPQEQVSAAQPKTYVFHWDTYTLTHSIDNVVYDIEVTDPQFHPSINMLLYTAPPPQQQALLNLPGGAENLPERWRWKSGEAKGDRFMMLRNRYNDLVVGTDGSLSWSYMNGAHALNLYGFQNPVGGIPMVYIQKTTNESATEGSLATRRIPSFNIPKDTLVPWKDDSFLILKPMLIEQRLPLLSETSDLDLTVSALPTTNLYEQRINTASPYVCGYPVVKYGKVLDHAVQPLVWHYSSNTLSCPNNVLLEPEWKDVHNRYSAFACNYIVLEDGYCDWMCSEDTADCGL